MWVSQILLTTLINWIFQWLIFGSQILPLIWIFQTLRNKKKTNFLIILIFRNSHISSFLISYQSNVTIQNCSFTNDSLIGNQSLLYFTQNIANSSNFSISISFIEFINSTWSKSCQNLYNDGLIRFEEQQGNILLSELYFNIVQLQGKNLLVCIISFFRIFCFVFWSKHWNHWHWIYVDQFSLWKRNLFLFFIFSFFVKFFTFKALMVFQNNNFLSISNGWIQNSISGLMN